MGNGVRAFVVRVEASSLLGEVVTMWEETLGLYDMEQEEACLAGNPEALPRLCQTLEVDEQITAAVFFQCMFGTLGHCFTPNEIRRRLGLRAANVLEQIDFDEKEGDADLDEHAANRLYLQSIQEITDPDALLSIAILEYQTFVDMIKTWVRIGDIDETFMLLEIDRAQYVWYHDAMVRTLSRIKHPAVALYKSDWDAFKMRLLGGNLGTF